MRRSGLLQALRARLAVDQPWWQCGFRPFFVGGAGLAALALCWWAAALLGGAPLPPAARAMGGSLWHAQALLLGLGLAAVAGFLLTAVPEFTGTPAVAPRAVRRLALAWALAVLGDSLGGATGRLLAAAGWSVLLGGLLAELAPRLWRDPGRPHLGFVPALLALAAALALWQADHWRGRADPRGLLALLGVMMLLMVLAMSRISMRVLNDALEQARAAGQAPADRLYLARPPRRHLAMACIGAHTGVQLLWPGHASAGWLALAAAAAMAHLLNDWHVGRALLGRRPLMLYLVYVAMAGGYAVLGAGTLAGAPAWRSAGWHLLGIGGFGLGILAVMAIAGRTHAGLPPDERGWLPWAVAALLAAAVLRVAPAAGAAPLAAWALAAAGWTVAWSLVLWWLAPPWWRARADGRRGCAGPPEDGHGC